VEWSQANFGFEEVARSDEPDLAANVALMRLGDRPLQILEPYEPVPNSLKRLGTKHMALAVDDVDQTCERLRANGVAIETDVVAGRTSQYLFCKDPDGILIEVIQS